MTPLRVRGQRKRHSASILLVAAGALAGLALGAMLADRTGGLSAILGRDRKRRHEEDAQDQNDELEATNGDETEEEAKDADSIADEKAETRGTGPFVAGLDDETEETTLEKRVLEAFHNDPVLKERAIDIGAIGTGVIELTGWVQAPWETGHAVTLARGVPDVTTVVDRLAVRDGERRKDHNRHRFAGESIRDVKSADSAPRRAD